MNKDIKNKIQELYNATPKEVGVGWGKKIKNGQYTGEQSIVFTVQKKKPFSEIPSGELLPSFVFVNGEKIKTDVIEVGEVKLLACDGTTLSSCYDWTDNIYLGTSVPIANWNKIRPIQGGIQIASVNNAPAVGTLGFIAVDNNTNSLVGVTNNHVVIKNAFYTTERPHSNLENESDDTVYQNYIGVGDDIGKVIRYVPILKDPDVNQVDGALIGLNSSVIDLGESFKQYGLSYALPMEFASTAEIDGLVGTNPPLYSSGRTTGPKEGDCALSVLVSDYNFSIGYYWNGGYFSTITYTDIIIFRRANPDCPWPIQSGDSGSALIADFSGTWKIIGLIFAGGTYDGFACRIDKVADQLNISAWDGTAKDYIDFSSQEIITVTGTSADKTISCNGKTYWQIGSGITNNPCVT